MNENPWKARWSKEQVKAMLLEQSQAFWQRDTGTERTQLAQIEQAVSSPHAVIISGLRRVGKSTSGPPDHTRPRPLAAISRRVPAGGWAARAAQIS